MQTKVIRILEYSGDIVDVEKHLEKRIVKGNKMLDSMNNQLAGDASVTIREIHIQSAEGTLRLSKPVKTKHRKGAGSNRQTTFQDLATGDTDDT